MKIKASFDDATVHDIWVADLVKKYNVETIFYWPSSPQYVNEPKGRSSLSPMEMLKLSNDFEIGSHTITHPLLTRIPQAEAKTEIEESKALLEKVLAKKITSFCYPRGYANPEIQAMVKEAGYKNARSTLVGYVHPSENPFFEQTAVHVACNRKEYAGLDWYDYGLKLLEVARKIPDSVFHIWGHSWEIEENKQWEKFESFLQKVTS